MNTIYLGNNVYHVNVQKLPPLIESLLNYKNYSTDDNYDKILNNLYDFENSYYFDKNLLFDLINEDLQINSKLETLYLFYQYYESQNKLYDFYEKIVKLYKVSQKQQIPSNCEESAFYQEFCNYTGNDENLQYLWNYVKISNDYAPLIQYYLKQEIITYNELLEDYFNKKANYVENLYSYINEETLEIQPEFEKYQVLKKFDKNIDFNFLTNVLKNSFENKNININGKDFNLTYDDNIDELTSGILLINSIYYNDSSDIINDVNNTNLLINDINDVNSHIDELNEIKSKLENNQQLSDEDKNNLISLQNDIQNKNLVTNLNNIINNIKEKNNKIIYLQSSFYNGIIAGSIIGSKIQTISQKINNIYNNIQNKLNDLINNLTTSETFSTLKDVSLVLGSIYALFSVVNDPTGFIKSIINLIMTPIEAVLGLIDTLICDLKSILCAIVSTVKTISNFITFIGNILEKLSTDTAKMISDFISNLKNNTSNSMNSNYYNLVRNYQSIFTARIAQDVALKLGTDKAQQFSQAAMEVFDECFTENSLLAFTKNYINQVIDNLQESVENTINNILSLRDVFNCSGATFNCPSIGFNPSSIKFEIPYISSKNIKCY